MEIVITVRDEDAGSSPTNILAFREWFESMCRIIPNQYRGGAMSEINASYYYGSAHANIVVTYEREETPEEVSEREAQKRHESLAIENRERALLERLQRKYQNG